MSSQTASSSLVSSDTGTTTNLRSEIFERCFDAYWDNERFANSLIDAPERLQALFDVVLGYTHQYGAQEVLERLTEASQSDAAKVDR